MYRKVWWWTGRGGVGSRQRHFWCSTTSGHCGQQGKTFIGFDAYNVMMIQALYLLIMTAWCTLKSVPKACGNFDCFMIFLYHNYLHGIDVDSIVAVQGNARPLKIVKNCICWLLLRLPDTDNVKWTKQHWTNMEWRTSNFQAVCSHLYLVVPEYIHVR